MTNFNTLLFKAAEAQDVAAARNALDHGADPNFSEYGYGKHKARRVLHVVAGNGCLEIFEMLKALPNFQINVPNQWGDYAHHIAASYPESLPILEVLLDSLDVNLRSCDDGRTPLHHAVEVGNVEAVKLLLDRGASQLVRNDMTVVLSGPHDHGEETAWDYAFTNERSMDCVELLLNDVKNADDARRMCTDKIKFYGKSPVELAKIFGRDDVVEFITNTYTKLSKL